MHSNSFFKYVVILTIAFIIAVPARTQTVVRMDMPPQPDEPLQAVTLFEEELYPGVPTILGEMGYLVTGGTSPFTWEWFENSELIATGDVAPVTPEAGNEYHVTITDVNNCSVTIPIIISFSDDEITTSEDAGSMVSVRTGHGQNLISLSPGFDRGGTILLRFYDMRGILHLEESITGSSDIPVRLPAGIYLLHIEGEGINHVERVVLL